MSIFQSTVVLRHFASLSVHHYILGHTPSPGALDLPQVSFTFDLVVDPESCILGHIPSSQVCLQHYLSHPLVVGHLIRSFIILSVQLESGAAPISISHSSCQFESGPHLYRSVIRRVSLSRGRTYIDRPSFYQFSSSRGRTYIDQSLSCQFESGPHLYQSAIFLSVQFESGPHLYRSVIVLSD